MSEYIQEFKSAEDVVDQYRAPSGALDDATVHLAWYGYVSYCGASLVVFEKNGKLYEVNGSHCSCNGLEGQWQPEETDWAALKHRAADGFTFDGEYEAGEQAKEVLLDAIAKAEGRS